MCRATAAGLDWKQVQKVDEATLETRLCRPLEGTAGLDRPRPDLAYAHSEWSRPAHLEYLEYLEKHTKHERIPLHAICEVYRQWAKRCRLSMRPSRGVSVSESRWSRSPTPPTVSCSFLGGRGE